MEKPQLRAVHGKASKCLQFPINTTCTSSHPTSDSAAVCQQERYYTSTRLTKGRSPIQSQPYGLVLSLVN